jgi:hypothetical protein
MSIVRTDPGRCLICGAAHTACTVNSGPITAVQLPARDGELEPPPLVGAVETPPLVAEVVQDTLPAGQFTSGTYRGKGGKFVKK